MLPSPRIKANCPCHVCGEQDWNVKKCLEFRSGRKKLADANRKVTKMDFRGNKVEYPVQKYSLPYKYLYMFSNIDPSPNPIINSPKPDPLSTNSGLGRIIEGTIEGVRKELYLLEKIARFTYEKYSETRQLINLIPAGILTHLQEFSDAIDDRHKRGWNEWIKIIEYARETSYRAASKKFYGITTDGRKIPLSPRYIKRKEPEATKYVKNYLKTVPRSFFLMKNLMDFVMKKPELLSEYKRLEEEYDHLESKHQENRSKSRPYKYTYYKVYHRDPQLYQRQKLDYQNGSRKGKPDGRIECGRFKKIDLKYEVLRAIGSEKLFPKTKLSTWPIKEWMYDPSNLPNTMLSLIHEVASDLLKPKISRQSLGNISQ